HSSVTIWVTTPNFGPGHVISLGKLVLPVVLCPCKWVYGNEAATQQT
ncbi:hypothetical protein LINPERPRIM_LOCUS37624, partial [Linum perenne]